MKLWTIAAMVGLVLVACPPPGPVPPPEDGGVDGGTDGGVADGGADGGQPVPVTTENLCGFLASVQSDTVHEFTGTHATPYDLDDEAAAVPGDSSGVGDHACFLTPTASNVTLRAAPGANPLFKGFLLLYGADGWVFDNIDFTQHPVPASRQGGLLKLVGGNGWKVMNSELFFPSCQDCGDFAALAFGFTQGFATPTSWEISGNWFHDNPGCVGQPFCTYGVNQSKFQNHFIYGIGNPATPQNGVIRNNLLVNAPNGFGIKLGGSGTYDGSQGVNTVVIENNTVVQNASQTTGAAQGQHTGLPVLIDDDCYNLTFRRNIFHEASSGASDPVATLVLGTGYNVLGKGFSSAISFDDNVMTAPTSAVVLYFQGCTAEFLPRSAATTYGYNKYPIGCAPQSAILSLAATVDGTGLIAWPAPAPGVCSTYAPVTVGATTYGAPASVCTGN